MSARIPSSTYRLQLNRDLTLEQAADLIDYFNKLGISDFYLSPLAQARAGSTHCYDVTDHGVLNREIGNEDAFREFATSAGDRDNSNQQASRAERRVRPEHHFGRRSRVRRSVRSLLEREFTVLLPDDIDSYDSR